MNPVGYQNPCLQVMTIQHPNDPLQLQLEKDVCVINITQTEPAMRMRKKPSPCF